jgi:hypothetical protein
MKSAELDFLVTKGMKKIGFEIKYSDAPKITKSMRAAMEALKLDQLYIITPGECLPKSRNLVTDFESNRRNRKMLLQAI